MDISDTKSGLFQMTNTTEVYKYMNALATAEATKQIELSESDKGEIFRFIQDTNRAVNSPTH